MDAAMRALTKEQIMDAGLTKKVALEHDTVMIEQTKTVKEKERYWADRCAAGVTS